MPPSAAAVGAGLVLLSPLVVGVLFEPGRRLSASQYLVLHNVIELFSVTVSLSIFGVEWHSFRQAGNRRGLFLGAAFLAIGLLDFLHAFSAPGMPDLITANGPEKSLVFRVAARLVTAAALLGSLWIRPQAGTRLLGKGALRSAAMSVVGLVTLAALLASERVAALLLAAGGVAALQGLWEVPLTATFLLTAWLVWRRASQDGAGAPLLPLWALLGCAVSELAMALAATSGDWFSTFGHLYQAASFYLIYRAVFGQAVGEPYQRLFDTGARLEVEVAEHQRASAELRGLNRSLEERTAELHRDITERRRLEGELKEATSFNETIVLQSPVGTSVYRSDGACILANEALATIVGTTRGTLEQQNFFRIESWQRAGWIDAAVATLASGVPHRRSELFTSGFERTVWVDVQMLRVLVNGAPHLLVLTLDVTEAHQTAEVLRRARDRLQLATDVAGIGVWNQSFDDGRLVWDDQMFELFEVPLDQRGPNVGPDTWRARVHPEDLARADRALRRGLRSQVPFGSEFRLRFPDGRVRHVQAAAFVERDTQGRPREIVGITRDVTLERELERSLREAKTAADAANQAKGEFLANMSHEIRTPLNAVLGLTQLVLDTELDATQRRSLERVQASSKTLLGILNDILDYSKIEAGRLELEAVDFELDELLHHTIELFSAPAEDKHVELVLETAPEVPSTVNGDPLRVGQVLNNLVGNAVKFTEQGEVHVLVEPAANGQGLRFSVRDTGIGMSDAQVSRLFQAFSQADTSTTRKFGGTGLGLTICQRLVSLMKGRLEVESRLGHGTSVHVTLPLKGASAGSGLHRPVELTPRRTLVVDHHETTRRALARLLGAWSFEVCVASSGAEGLAALEEAAAAGRPFELLFVDWKLPGLSGLDFLKKVRGRAEPGPRALAVLLVSAFEGAPLARSAGAAAIDRVLEKPVSRSRLAELLGALQDGARPSASGEPVHSAGSLFERARPIHGARVLVVEDNPTNQLVASGLLEKMGLIVEVVSDGREAVERASAERYDVVLMDLQMPGVDGLEATRRLRATELGQRVPIIAMTAAAMQRDREASQAAGMNGHVDKPVDAEDLLSALLAWVPHRPATPKGGPSRKARRPSAAAMGSARGVDFDPDGALLRLGGDLALYRRILGTFEAEVAQMSDGLKDAVGAGDWKAARGLAHKLKGAAGNAGAWALARQAADLEWDLKHHRDRGLWALEEKVRRAVQHCRRFLVSSSPSPRPTPSVSREVVGEALEELHRMLRGHRIVPHELLEQVEAGRAWGVGDDAMNALAGAVESFRYEEALAALEPVREQLEVVHVEPSLASAPADSPGGRLTHEPADLGRDPLA